MATKNVKTAGSTFGDALSAAITGRKAAKKSDAKAGAKITHKTALGDKSNTNGVSGAKTAKVSAAKLANATEAKPGKTIKPNAAYTPALASDKTVPVYRVNNLKGLRAVLEAESKATGYFVDLVFGMSAMVLTNTRGRHIAEVQLSHDKK